MNVSFGVDTVEGGFPAHPDEEEIVESRETEQRLAALQPDKDSVMLCI